MRRIRRAAVILLLATAAGAADDPYCRFIPHKEEALARLVAGEAPRRYDAMESVHLAYCRFRDGDEAGAHAIFSLLPRYAGFQAEEARFHLNTMIVWVQGAKPYSKERPDDPYSAALAASADGFLALVRRSWSVDIVDRFGYAAEVRIAPLADAGRGGPPAPGSVYPRGIEAR